MTATVPSPTHLLREVTAVHRTGRGVRLGVRAARGAEASRQVRVRQQLDRRGGDRRRIGRIDEQPGLAVDHGVEGIRR